MIDREGNLVLNNSSQDNWCYYKVRKDSLKRYNTSPKYIVFLIIQLIRCTSVMTSILCVYINVSYPSIANPRCVIEIQRQLQHKINQNCIKKHLKWTAYVVDKVKVSTWTGRCIVSTMMRVESKVQKLFCF